MAVESNATVLLMDDRAAVIHARSLGFRVAPTISIYILAKHRGIIHAVKPKIDHLRMIGFRLTENDYNHVFSAAGERS